MFALALVGMLSSALGGLFKGVGALKSGEASNNYYRDLADSAERQAKETEKTAGLNMKFSAEKQAKEAAALNRVGKEVAASQEAALASSGAGAGSVVSQDVVADTLTKKAMDEVLIANNADLERWSISRERDSKIAYLKDQARQYRSAGHNALEASGYDFWASILGSASSTASLGISAAPYLSSSSAPKAG